MNTLIRIRTVFEDELEPTGIQAGVEAFGFGRVAWYLTGQREDGVPMCQAVLFHWDELDKRWIEVSPQRPVADAAILEQPTYGAPVAIVLQKVRGERAIKLRRL